MKIYVKNKKKHLFIAFYALGKSYRMFIANRPITFGAGLSLPLLRHLSILDQTKY